ncbi:MAG: hypothetical protein HY520_03820 [Candidatus Aenigmarchaeota archaeon]|nr:hypothetical protein [Candidatus Aenigmarchaeota archaeon]
MKGYLRNALFGFAIGLYVAHLAESDNRHREHMKRLDIIAYRLEKAGSYGGRSERHQDAGSGVPPVVQPEELAPLPPPALPLVERTDYQCPYGARFWP